MVFLFALKPILKALLPLNFMYHLKNWKMPLLFLVLGSFFPRFFTLGYLKLCYLVYGILGYIIHLKN